MVKKKTSRYDAEAKKALRDSGVKTIQVRVPDLSRFHPDGYGGGAIIAVEVILPQTSATFVSGDDREPGRIGASIGSVLRQFYVYNPAQKRIEFVEDFKKLWKRYAECYERGKSLPDVLNTQLTHDLPCQMYRQYMDWRRIGSSHFLPVEYANEEIAEFVRFCEQPPTVRKQEAPAPAAAPAAPKQADPAPAPAAPKQAG